MHQINCERTSRYLHEQLEESFVQTCCPGEGIDARDSYTQDHSQRMAALIDP